MQSKLNLNQDLVNQARESAKKVANDVQGFIDLHTTVTVERAVVRLLGIDGVNEVEVPLPNVIVDHLLEKGILPLGGLDLKIQFYLNQLLKPTGNCGKGK